MQRYRWFALTLVAFALSASTGWAQDRSFDEVPTSDSESAISLPSRGQVTPEMSFYMQEYRRYQQPKEAVRRKAEFRSAQRQRRLAAQRWFGFSKLRPVANPIPWYGSYSPSWVGNGTNSYGWTGYGTPYVTYHATSRDR
jgi:hypothetical protein